MTGFVFFALHRWSDRNAVQRSRVEAARGHSSVQSFMFSRSIGPFDPNPAESVPAPGQDSTKHPVPESGRIHVSAGVDLSFAVTEKTCTGRLIPFMMRSSTGSKSTLSRTETRVRSETRTWPGSADAASRAATLT